MMKGDIIKIPKQEYQNMRWSLVQMKASEQCSPVVLLFITLHKVVLIFEFVDEILKCDDLNKSYWAVLSCGDVHYVVKGGSYFGVCGRNLKMLPFKWKLGVVLSCGAVYHNEQRGSNFCVCGWNPRELTTIQCLSFRTVYYSVQGGSNFWSWGWNPKVWPFKWKLLSTTFLWYCLLFCTRWF